MMSAISFADDRQALPCNMTSEWTPQLLPEVAPHSTAPPIQCMTEASAVEWLGCHWVHHPAGHTAAYIPASMPATLL
jgi:hypothetical protein